MLTNPPAPTYDISSHDPARCTTLSPANIRAIRLTLRLRSDRPDTVKGLNWAGDVVNNAENRTGTLNAPGYRLFTTQLDVTLRNMKSTASFIF